MEDFFEAQPSREFGHGSSQRQYFRPKGMSQSFSESTLDFRKDLQKNGTGPLNHTTLASAVSGLRLSEDTSYSSNSSSSRGRSLLRTPSPTKDLDIIEEVPSSEERSSSPIKRSRSPVKQLFGENGWLGKSMDKRSGSEPRKNTLKHWGDKIRQRVDHLVSSHADMHNESSLTSIQTEDMPKIDMTKLRPSAPQVSQSPSRSKTLPQTRFYVSVTPPQQAKLYAELELMICASANDYLAVQQREGRMSLESLSTVLQTWANKHRPQVIEFMFDQTTQRDLVVFNLNTFRFFGPNASNIVSVNSMVHAWKSLAREMAVRTFCSPDVVVRKHLHDCYSVLELLGAPQVTLRAFAQIRDRTEKVIEEGRKKRADYERMEWGTEKRWEPRTSDQDVEALNPFA